MIKDTTEGQTHSFNDGCGEPKHNEKAECKNCTPEVGFEVVHILKHKAGVQCHICKQDELPFSKFSLNK